VTTVAIAYNRTGDEWQMFVYPRARDALAKTATYTLLTSPRKRLIGFLPLDEYFSLSDYEAMQLEAVFGPPLHATEAVGRGKFDVEVVMVPPSDAVPGPAEGGSLARKRATWNHQPRNGLVARLARAVLARDPSCLGQLSVALPEFIINLGRSPRVVVLVESSEHARRLHAELPDWRLMDALQASPEGTAARRIGRRPGTIVTATAADREMLQADVVVLADGGTLSAEFKERRFARRDRPLWMLDVADAVLGSVGERIEAYQRRGWKVDGKRRLIVPKARSRKPPTPTVTVDWLEEQLRFGDHDLRYVLGDDRWLPLGERPIDAYDDAAPRDRSRPARQAPRPLPDAASNAQGRHDGPSRPSGGR
jgi:hypothetical protein